jgi:hypothetical protein
LGILPIPRKSVKAFCPTLAFLPMHS